MSVYSPPTAAARAPASALSPGPSVWLQRKCDCGGSGGCGGCRDEKPFGLQRKLAVGDSDDAYEREADRVADEVMGGGRVTTSGGAPPAIRRLSAPDIGSGTAPTSATEVVAGPGRPLDLGTRNFFEPRFGRDFSHVRIHADAAAASSARDVNALAYTVGPDIVFGAGQFAPATPRGARLIAHELTHVAQQGPTVPTTLRRKRAAPEFPDEDLQRYLGFIDANGIEDDSDSDDKAREIVKAWRLGGSPFVLTAHRKALLIKEMQSGFTGDADEEAILELLERSYKFELQHIFKVVDADDLNSDIHGEEYDRLKDFYHRRFAGGMKALLKGKIEPIGDAVPLGVGLPALSNLLAESEVFMDRGTTGWNVPCLLGILCQEDRAVVAQLPKLTVQKAETITEVYWQFEGKAWVRKTRERGAFSKSDEDLIGLKTSLSCGFAARTIIHEVRHQNQPEDMGPLGHEFDAYRFEEEWAIQRGIPARNDQPEFRTGQPGQTGQKANVPAIERYVKGRYSGAAAGSSEDRVIGHKDPDKSVVLKADKTEKTQPAAEGESHQDIKATEANLKALPKVDPKAWACPKAATR